MEKKCIGRKSEDLKSFLASVVEQSKDKSREDFEMLLASCSKNYANEWDVDIVKGLVDVSACDGYVYFPYLDPSDEESVWYGPTYYYLDNHCVTRQDALSRASQLWTDSSDLKTPADFAKSRQEAIAHCMNDEDHGPSVQIVAWKVVFEKDTVKSESPEYLFASENISFFADRTINSEVFFNQNRFYFVFETLCLNSETVSQRSPDDFDSLNVRV